MDSANKTDSDTGRVPPGAALDQLIARMRDRANYDFNFTARAQDLTLEWANALERFRAALDAQPPQAPQEWRPIETHDGTPMPVLIAEQYGNVVEAYFSECHQAWWELNSVDDGSPGSDRRVYPTHWQPLPHPPAADARRPGQEPE